MLPHQGVERLFCNNLSFGYHLADDGSPDNGAAHGNQLDVLEEREEAVRLGLVEPAEEWTGDEVRGAGGLQAT